MKRILNKLFNSNNKAVKKYSKLIVNINAEWDLIKDKSDSEILELFNLQKDEKNVEKVYALIKEGANRTLGLLAHDVQLIGALALNDGNIAEMKTGEGKTLVGTFPAIYNSLKGSVHVVTVNDYLAERDGTVMEPLYNYFGLSVGKINDLTLNKKEEYSKDVLYISNHTLAFDYLRDNMIYDKHDRFQNSRDFVIIDEVDSILIDEARNPLIISGEADSHSSLFLKANELAITLEKGTETKNRSGEVESTTGDFLVDLETKQITLTESGIIKAEEFFDVGNIYEEENVVHIHYLSQSLTAHYSKHIDVDYIVKDGLVKIIDQSTGRISEGVRYSDGLHQAIEVKENVEVKPESQSLASTTYQNFFRTYKKMSGMTGTAETEASEFLQTYKIGVVTIPTNKQIQRRDYNDLIYMTKEEKYDAIIDLVKSLNKKGQPILIGTTSIQQSEILHKILTEANIVHEVLNAKNHLREAEIISKAGEKSSVTLATNMAGRGVDIKVSKESMELGGLYIIGSERHESRRIDNQLRGRSGRQGDKGVSQFFLSLEDDLMVMFGGDKVKRIVKALGMAKGEAIDSGMINKSIEKSQKKIETMNFEQRKNLIEYDDILNEQRKVIYDTRNQILEDVVFYETKEKELLSAYLKNLISSSKNAETLELDINNIIMAFEKDIDIEIDPVNLESFTEENDINKYLEELMLDVKDFRLTHLVEDDELKKQISIHKYLLTLDEIWKNHIYALDILKTGIGLRSYNQKDPLIEYKKESYHMFINMISEFKHKAIKSIFGVQR